MIVFINTSGTVQQILPSPVYQGQGLSGSLYLVAPFPASNGVDVSFILPNGEATESYALTPSTVALPDTLTANGERYSVWEWQTNNGFITAIAGQVTAQFRVYAFNQSGEDETVATASVNFTVQSGVIPLDKETPTADQWANLVTLYSQAVNNITKVRQALEEDIIKAPEKTFLVWKGSSFPDVTISEFDVNENTVIDWGDGNSESYPADTKRITHTYSDNIDYHLIKISNLTSISGYALSNCSGLIELVVGNTITRVGEGASSDCGNLEKVIYKATAPLSFGAFYNCSKLRQVELLADITEIGESAFESCTSLEEINIPTTVTSIASGAFNSCKNLKSVIIPDSVTEIANSAFEKCTNLKSIVLSNNITTLPGKALASCANLTSLEIPDSVTSIENKAFFNCSNLKNIVFGKGAVTFDSTMLSGCTALEYVAFKAESGYSQAELSKIVIPTNSLKKIFVPKSCIDDYKKYLNADYTKYIAYKTDSSDIDDLQAETTAELAKKYDKTGGTVDGDVTITGDLTVIGKQHSQVVEYLEVKSAMIYSNSDGVKLAELGGIGIKANETDTYGIVYDPQSDSVKLGIGKADENGKFTFNEGEGEPVAVRDDSSKIADGDLLKWDSTNNKLVDSGKGIDNLVDTDSEQTIDGKKTFANETAFNGVVEHSEDIRLTDSKVEVLDYATDTTTGYLAGKITNENGDDNVTLTIPQKSGNIATSVDLAGYAFDTDKTYFVWGGTTFPNGNAGTTFKLPTDAIIDWGDGTSEKGAGAELTHTYYDDSTYHVITLEGANTFLSATTANSPKLIGVPIKKVIFSKGVTSVLEEMFKSCLSLEEVIFSEGSGLTSIGNSAFFYCQSLKAVKGLPTSLTSIGEQAFMSCLLLEDCKLPEGLTTIANYGFYDCRKLILTLPSTLTSFGTYFNDDASYIEKITFKGTTPPTINNNSTLFYIKKIIVPKSAVNTYKSAKIFSGFSSIIVYEVDSSDIPTGYVTTDTNQDIKGIKTFTQYIKTPQVASTDGKGLVRYKSTEVKSVFGNDSSAVVLMGNTNRPYYSKSGSDFTGSEIALKSDVSSLESTFGKNLSSEATTRANADTALETKITSEATTRASADTALETKINNLSIGTFSVEVWE